MQNNVLKDHYERKYSDESTAAELKSIKATDIPISRFEAVVNFFPIKGTGQVP